MLRAMQHEPVAHLLKQDLEDWTIIYSLCVDFYHHASGLRDKTL